jgi:Spy/CpxP family protein refolding chaperone
MMKQSKITAPLLWLAAVLLLAVAASTYAQNGSSPTPPVNQTPNNTEPTPAQDLPSALSFTPQQAEQWRQINREFRVQQMTAGAKARDARLALNEAIESPNHNEELIKQRAKELADAQSAVTQLQALRQSRVLQLLTPDQRLRLKQIREARARDLRRGPQPTNAFDQRDRLRRNANAPLVTPAQRRALREQQKKQKP